VHVKYTLKVDSALYAEKEAAVTRAFELHPDSCPVYRSIHTAIDITKELEVVKG